MGVREMDRFLEQWQMDAKALRRRMVLAPAGTLVRHLAAGTGLDSSSDGRGAGAGPTHHWTMGVGLRRGRGPAALMFEQTGGSPPPLARRNRRI